MKKDESGKTTVEVSVELPCTPEEVWKSIATGPGISAWFMAMDLKEGVGEITVDTPEGKQVIGKTKVWQPPHTMIAEGPMFGPGGPTVGTEWHIEAKSGGRCIVRVVHSLFASSDDWDDQLGDVEKGWPRYFRVLRLYIERFRHMTTAMPIQVMRPVALDQAAAWKAITHALGVAGQPVGTPFAAPAGSPPFAGKVAEVVGDELSRGLLILEAPCPGIVSPAVFKMVDQVMIHLSLYLYGEEAPAIAQRDASQWQAWLDGIYAG